VEPLWKKIWRFLKNLNIDLPYDPAIPFLGIHPKECNPDYSRGSCTPMFIASAIHSSQVMETAKMLHYSCMGHENVVFVHNGILLSREEE
jgi:hypothetical protein